MDLTTTTDKEDLMKSIDLLSGLPAMDETPSLEGLRRRLGFNSDTEVLVFALRSAHALVRLHNLGVLPINLELITGRVREAVRLMEDPFAVTSDEIC